MMMHTQLLEFSIKHIGLISATFATLCALGVVEYLQWIVGSQAISPTRVTLLMNRHHAKVLDVREESEFLKAHLPGAMYVGPQLKEVFFNQLQTSQPIILVTSEASPSFNMLKQLRAAGCSELYHIRGGITAWEEAHLPMIRSLLEN